MENMNMENERVQLKEQITNERLVKILRGWADAIEDGEDFEFVVKGEKRRVPHDALSKGVMNLEAEWKRGQNEFELELKWEGKPEDMHIKH